MCQNYSVLKVASDINISVFPLPYINFLLNIAAKSNGMI